MQIKIFFLKNVENATRLCGHFAKDSLASYTETCLFNFFNVSLQHNNPLTHSFSTLDRLDSIIPHIILCRWKTRQKCPQNDTFSFVRNPAGISSLTPLLPPSAEPHCAAHGSVAPSSPQMKMTPLSLHGTWPGRIRCLDHQASFGESFINDVASCYFTKTH